MADLVDLDELAARAVASPVAHPPDLETLQGRARTRHRRRIAQRVVATSVAVLIVGSLSVRLWTTHARSTHVQTGGSPATSTTIAPPALSPAALAAAVTNALATIAPQRVFHSSSATSELWIDGQSLHQLDRNADGHPTRELAARLTPGVPGAMQSLIIDYVAKTWSMRDLTASADIPLPQLPPPGGHGTQLAADLASGAAVVRANEIVDGRLATRVDTTQPVGVVTSQWFDAETYLPIQSGVPGSVVTYQWLPRSPEVLASLWPSIPLGFTDQS
jgi:hypothetical protein